MPFTTVLQKFSMFIILSLSMSMMSASASEAIPQFDIARNYNAFILGDFSANATDSQGKVAAGGRVDVSSYGLATGITTGAQEVTLISGGDITYSNGRIFTGGVLAQGDASGITAEVLSGMEFGASVQSNTPTPFSFTDEFEKLTQLSESLSALPDTGFVEYKWGGTYLTGDCESITQIFTIDGNALLSSSSLVLSCVPEASTLILNITGSVGGFKNIGLSHLNSRANRTLYNFPQATSIDFMWIGVEGTVLAPLADIVNPRGSLNGAVMAKSWNGPMSLQYTPFVGVITDIEPDENNAPIFTSQPIVEIFQGELYQYFITAEDSDMDSLTYELVQSPEGLLLASDNIISWVPTVDQIGQNEVILSVTDGQDTVEQAFTILVVAPNTVPVVAAIEPQVMSENEYYEIQIISSDAENDVLSYTLMNAPPFMSLQSSKLIFEPGYDDAGTYGPVQISVSDAEFTVTADVSFDVLNVNRAPTFTSIPVIEVGENQSYTYHLSGEDSDTGDSLGYSLGSAPLGMSLDSEAGILQWLPTASDIGTHSIVIYVTDSEGLQDVQEYTLTVFNINDAPSISSQAILEASEGLDYSYDVDASDPDGDLLVYNLTSGPEGMTIDSMLGLAQWTPSFTQEGVHTITIEVSDPFGLTDSQTFSIRVANTNRLPSIFSLPINSIEVGESYAYAVQALDEDGDLLTFSLLDSPVGMNIDPQVGTVLWEPTQGGDFSVVIQVSDVHGGIDAQSFNINVQIPNSEPELTVFALSENNIYTNMDLLTLSGLATDDEDGDLSESIEWYSSLDGSIGLGKSITTRLSPGSHEIVATVTDSASASISKTSTVTVSEVVLPTEPSTQAIPINTTEVEGMHQSISFLYTGDNPVQTNAIEDTFDTNRIGVIKGRVIDRSGNPVPGITVSVQDHEEYGQTLSRENGVFDIAVNGGSNLMINFNRGGYLPIQRTVYVPWNRFVALGDVVVLGFDPEENTIDLTDTTAPFQVAKGSTQIDEDGSRKARVLFPRNVQATMSFEDGSEQALEHLTVRATEYTVGNSGLLSMPGDLPMNSAYTYAVELSVDEAVSADAERVDFDQPLSVYVDNFLSFPVGLHVPSGWYDRKRGAWIPAPDGRVIQLLAIDGDTALIDTDGDGVEDDLTVLDELGITTDELKEIAQMFTVDSTFWRVPVDHFTPWDFNFPGGPPLDAITPPEQSPDLDTQDSLDSEDTDECKGCVIDPQRQTLGEDIGVVGTGQGISYRSDRVHGRASSRFIKINLSDDRELPETLQSVSVTISIAGKKEIESFAPSEDMIYEYEWDGLDSYGRAIPSIEATVNVAYNYSITYFESPSDRPESFNRISRTGAVVGRRQAQQISVNRSHKIRLRSNSPDSAGLGGWSLNSHHTYDPEAKILYLGNGDKRTATNLTNITTRIAGNGERGPSIEGAALETSVVAIDLKSDSLGRIYFAGADFRIHRINLDGNIETIAGNGQQGFSGDGGLALDASMHPAALAIDNEGNLIIAGYGAGIYRLRKINMADGVITTIAGGGSLSADSENVPALDVSFIQIQDVEVSIDGNIYIADANNYRVRKIDPSGIISTVAGNGVYGPDGEGVIATNAELRSPTSIALGAHGDFYIGTGVFTARIRRVKSNGIIVSAALGETNGSRGLESDAFGNIYLSTSNSILKMDQYGRIETIVGPVFASEPASEGHSALRQSVNRPRAFTILPNGDFYYFDLDSLTIRKVVTGFPSTHTGDFVIPSRDASMVYIFNRNGRHLRTVDAVTGNTLLTFTYTENGLLSDITDLDGNQTAIERDGEGSPTAIIAPYGQRTELSVDANGYLESVTNPANEVHSMEYSSDGLLVSKTNPREFTNSFEYDSLGLFIKDSAPNAGWDIRVEDVLNTQDEIIGNKTIMSTKLGKEYQFSVENLEEGSRRFINTRPDGTQTIKIVHADGSESFTSADGTTISLTESADPRFSMLSPVLSRAITKTPGGLINTISTSRTVSLSDPANLLSLQSLTETTTVNDKQATSVYSALDSSWTSISPEGRQSTRFLNEKGRVQTLQIPNLADVFYEYDSQGRLERVLQTDGVEQREILYTYNTDGYTQTIEDSLGQLTSWSYDDAGRLTQQNLNGDRVIINEFDSNGNVTKVISPELTEYIYKYTDSDKVESFSLPSVDGEAAKESYRYTDDDQLLAVDFFNGDSQIFNRDELNKLTSIADSFRDIEYSYDPVSGRVAEIIAEEITTIIDYDGMLLTYQGQTGTVAGDVTFEYNNDFSIVGITLNNEVQRVYSYDDDNLLIGADALSIQYAEDNGFLSSTEIGVLNESFSYNAFGELERRTVVSDGQTLLETGLQYDSAGRITQKIDTIEGVSQVFDYQYDNAGRLREVKLNGVITEDYLYDKNGNRLTATVKGESRIAQIDARDRLLSYGEYSYQYDDNGSILGKNTGPSSYSYTHDIHRNLRKVITPSGDTIEYILDGNSRRVGKRINEQLVQGFIYKDDLNPIAELDGNGDLVSEFVYGVKMNIPELMIKDGIKYRIVSDHLGSPRFVVNTQTGAIAQRLSYDSYGNITEDTNPGFQPFGFAGGIYDQDTGLTKFGRRDYDAVAGRWVQSDPIGLAGGINTYAYVSNNPLSSIDPSGLAEDGVPLNPLNCDALRNLVAYADNNSKWATINKYNPINFSPDMAALDAAFPSVGGPVSIDWMMRSAGPWGATSLPGLSYLAYGGAKSWWNVGNGNVPWLNLAGEANSNAPSALSHWYYSSDVTLKEMFSESLKVCECIE